MRAKREQSGAEKIAIRLNDQRCSDHESDLMPFSLMILPQRASSFLRMLAECLRRSGGRKCAGVDQLLAQLGVVQRSVTTAALSLATTAAGVRAGASSAYQLSDIDVGQAELGEGRHVGQHLGAGLRGAADRLAACRRESAASAPARRRTRPGPGRREGRSAPARRRDRARARPWPCWRTGTAPAPDAAWLPTPVDAMVMPSGLRLREMRPDPSPS